MPNWIDGIATYCQILDETNKMIIKLIGMDCIDYRNEMESYFSKIAHNISILVPYSVNDIKTKLCCSDGILLFSSELLFIKADYVKLLNDYSNIFFNIKNIRSKYEHEPHNIFAELLSSGTSYPRATFKYLNNVKNSGIIEKKFTVDSNDLILIIKVINGIFNKVIEELRRFYFENHDKYENNLYFRKYTSLDFLRYNKLYDSNLLYDFSIAMQEY